MYCGDARERAALNRAWHVARLYQAGKVQHVLLSGGTTRTGTEPEAASMQRFLVALGVPPAAIWLKERSEKVVGRWVGR